MRERSRNQVYLILHAPPPVTPAGKVVGAVIFTLIILNVLAVVLETTAWGQARLARWFWPFEVFSVIVFTIEYVLRLWSAVESPEYSRPLWGRLGYARSPLALIDLLAILPFYLMFIPGLAALDLRFLRIARLIRVFRVFKITRYLEEVAVIGKVLREKKEEIHLTLFLGFVLLFISASLMYYVEHEAQPKIFASIPAAMWWAVVTLATVGYGDVYPITPLGKFLGAIIAMLGIGLFALPAGILASGFMEAMSKRRSKTLTCPHCGKKIELEK